MRVLITGASGGLGRAVVEEFLSQSHSVTAVARSWRDAGPFRQVAADLTNAAECRRLAEEVGEVDILAHLVGGFAGGTTVAATDDASWDGMMNINLRTAFLTIRAVLPGMLAHNHGRIIAVGARAGVEPVAGLSAYGVSKAGLVHLIRTLALELKPTNITANLVLPSTIDTPANRTAMPQADPSKWVSPASIAKVVAWLASDAARDISGALVPVYGKA